MMSELLSIATDIISIKVNQQSFTLSLGMSMNIIINGNDHSNNRIGLTDITDVTRVKIQILWSGCPLLVYVDKNTNAIPNDI